MVFLAFWFLIWSNIVPYCWISFIQFSKLALALVPFFPWMWYFPSKIRFVSSIWFEDVRNTRHCHVVNLANRETAVSSSVFLQSLWRNCAGVLTFYPTRQIFLPRFTAHAHITVASFLSRWTTIFNVSALLYGVGLGVYVNKIQSNM